jgi:vacuolar-type H+-ATPase subunit H
VVQVDEMIPEAKSAGKDLQKAAKSAADDVQKAADDANKEAGQTITAASDTVDLVRHRLRSPL